MSQERATKAVVFTVRLIVLLAIVFAGFGSAVLHLWNWLMPSLFGLHVINYWQAVGMMGLCWILFGGLRGFGRPVPLTSSKRKDFTPEERERLRSLLA